MLLFKIQEKGGGGGGLYCSVHDLVHDDDDSAQYLSIFRNVLPVSSQ